SRRACCRADNRNGTRRCCRQRAHGICRSSVRGLRNHQRESADCAVLLLSNPFLSPSYSYFTLAAKNAMATCEKFFRDAISARHVQDRHLMEGAALPAL